MIIQYISEKILHLLRISIIKLLRFISVLNKRKLTHLPLCNNIQIWLYVPNCTYTKCVIVRKYSPRNTQSIKEVNHCLYKNHRCSSYVDDCITRVENPSNFSYWGWGRHDVQHQDTFHRRDLTCIITFVEHLV